MSKTKSTTPPHHRLTLKDVIRDYQDGLITAKGAVFYAIAASRKLGEPVLVVPSKFAATLDITTRTYYRCVAELRVQKRLDLVVHGSMELKIPIQDSTGLPEYFFVEELGQICHNQGQTCHNLGQNDHSEGQTCHNLGQNDHSEGQICHKKSPDSPSEGSFTKPLSLLSLQSLSLTEEGEREKNLEIDVEKFRGWLRIRANALPQKPALLEQWISKEMEKESNQREFIQHQASLERASLPAIPLAEEILNPTEYWQKVNQRREANG